MKAQPILISLSPEVQEVLADNGIDLAEELNREIPKTKKENLPDPTIEDHNRTRDITLVIMASSASFFAISLGIEKIINSLTNRPSIVKRNKLVPVLNAKGEVVCNSEGEPILHWVEETEVIESKKNIEEEGKYSFSWLGLKVELNNKRKQT